MVKKGSTTKKKGRQYPHLWKAIIKNCIVCGKPFRAVRDSIRKKTKICGIECWRVRGRVVNICPFCEKEVRTFKSVNQKYCNRSCRDLHYKNRFQGARSHFWRGGKTKESQIRRTRIEYKEWRMAVFKRDGFKCVICGSKLEIEADHIKEVCRYPELIYDVNNGRTLCHKHHKETDNYGPKARWR